MKILRERKKTWKNKKWERCLQECAQKNKQEPSIQLMLSQLPMYRPLGELGKFQFYFE